MSDNAYPDALPPQCRLHWYILERVLGQGGFGITYLSRDTNLDQMVAIKEYLPVDVATRRPDGTVRSRTSEHQERYRAGLERFIREARTLARFDHPNIVRVHSVFEFNDTAYMVMRFEDGETLATLLERRAALPEAELMRIVLPILDGLELVHGAGFIHRDIKPDNIHIRADGTPVLLDFGSARHALGQSRTLTILVAPGYAPFEQYYSTGEHQGPWTDIYGLGATCYRAIAGRAPLDAIARSKGVLGSTKDMLLPAAVVGSGRYSERLLAAVDHALGFAEHERPQSIAEWRRELSGEIPVARAPRGSRPSSGDAAASAIDSKPVGPQRPLRSPMGGPVVWASAAIAAIALAATLILSLGGRESVRDAGRAAPGPAAESEDALRSRLAALEREQAEDRQRLAEVMARTEAVRKRQPGTRDAAALAAPAKPAAPALSPASSPAPVLPVPAPAERVAAPAAPPAGPSEAELLASAERAYARGSRPEAIATLKGLVEHHSMKAMVRLGDIYLQGEGVERNDKEAVNLFRRAAEQGDSEARTRLGDLYAAGRGVPQNNFQAYVWYSAAAQSGNPAAKASQERIGALLQPVELKQAGKVVAGMARPPKEQ